MMKTNFFPNRTNPKYLQYKYSLSDVEAAEIAKKLDKLEEDKVLYMQKLSIALNALTEYANGACEEEIAQMAIQQIEECTCINQTF